MLKPGQSYWISIKLLGISWNRVSSGSLSKNSSRVRMRCKFPNDFLFFSASSSAVKGIRCKFVRPRNFNFRKVLSSHYIRTQRRALTARAKKKKGWKINCCSCPGENLELQRISVLFPRKHTNKVLIAPERRKWLNKDEYFVAFFWWVWWMYFFGILVGKQRKSWLSFCVIFRRFRTIKLFEMMTDWWSQTNSFWLFFQKVVTLRIFA